MALERAQHYARGMIEREPNPELSEKAASVWAEIFEKVLEGMSRERTANYWLHFSPWLLRFHVGPQVRSRALSGSADFIERLVKFHEAVLWYEDHVDDRVVRSEA